MKPKIVLMLAICFVCISICNPSKAQQTITGFEAPESVVKAGDKIFVSNIGGAQPNPMALDSNGFISELSADGKMIERKFSKAILNGPKGLAVVGNVLYTADVNRVVGLDITTGNMVFELPVANAVMLNDAAAIDDNRIAVTETVSGKVYLVNIAAKTYDFIGSIDGANGVTYDAPTQKLYANGMGINMSGTGKLFVKDINSKDTVFAALPDSPNGVFDGLEMIDATHLLTTDWISMTSTTGRFVIYDLINKTSKTYNVDAGPADIGFDRTTQTFYLPQMIKNAVLIEKLAALK